MSARVNKLGVGLAMLGLLQAGCAPLAPHWESRFGNAVRASVAAQVADPGAARNANPVAGIDGRAAAAIQFQYVHSFGTPTAPEAAMISGSGK